MEYEFDAVDVGLLVAGVFASAVMVGIATFTVFDLSLSDTFTLGGQTISIAWLFTAATLVGTIATNENAQFDTDLIGEMQGDLEDQYWYVVVAAVGVLLGWILLPGIVQDPITGSDALGLAYVGVLTFAQLIVGYVY